MDCVQHRVGWRYLIRPDMALNTGRQLAPTQLESASDEPATAWFARLTSSSDAFAFAHDSAYTQKEWFPIFDVHGTSGRPVWIYERSQGADLSREFYGLAAVAPFG